MPAYFLSSSMAEFPVFYGKLMAAINEVAQ
jgi:hypothetical protein